MSTKKIQRNPPGILLIEGSGCWPKRASFQILTEAVVFPGAPLADSGHFRTWVACGGWLTGTRKTCKWVQTLMRLYFIWILLYAMRWIQLYSINIYVYSKTLKYKLGPFILTAPHPTLTITTQKPLGAFGESVGDGVSEASMYKSVLKSAFHVGNVWPHMSSLLLNCFGTMIDIWSVNNKLYLPLWSKFVLVTSCGSSHPWKVVPYVKISTAKQILNICSDMMVDKLRHCNAQIEQGDLRFRPAQSFHRTVGGFCKDNRMVVHKFNSFTGRWPYELPFCVEALLLRDKQLVTNQRAHWKSLNSNRMESILLFKSWEWQYFNSWSSSKILKYDDQSSYKSSIQPIKKLQIHPFTGTSHINSPFFGCLPGPSTSRDPRDHTTCEGQGWNFEVAKGLQTSQSEAAQVGGWNQPLVKKIWVKKWVHLIFPTRKEWTSKIFELPPHHLVKKLR